MTTSPRAPAWLPPLSIVVIALLVGIISLSPWRFVPFPVTAQLALLLILLRAFCYWPPVIRWAGAMPVPHRVVFGILIGAMILGHYTFSSRAYFPYVAWEIFPVVREDNPVTCREFIATTASGKRVRLLVEQLFPSIVQFNPPDDPEHLIQAMARVYDQRHAGDPVQSVDVVLMAVDLHPPAGESHSQPTCELLRRYEISSDR